MGLKEASEQLNSKIDAAFLEAAASDVGAELDREEIKSEADRALVTDAVPRTPQKPITQDYWSDDEEWAATSIGSTSDGKEVIVKKRPDGSGYIIRYNGPGDIPKALNGWYTTYDRAEKQARTWLNERHAKTDDKETNA